MYERPHLIYSTPNGSGNGGGNGYPKRFGNQRYDEYGRPLPGEYDQYGRRMGGNNPDLSLSGPHDWTAFQRAFPAPPARQPAPAARPSNGMGAIARDLGGGMGAVAREARGVTSAPPAQGGQQQQGSGYSDDNPYAGRQDDAGRLAASRWQAMKDHTDGYETHGAPPSVSQLGSAMDRQHGLAQGTYDKMTPDQRAALIRRGLDQSPAAVRDRVMGTSSTGIVDDNGRRVIDYGGGERNVSLVSGPPGSFVPDQMSDAEFQHGKMIYGTTDAGGVRHQGTASVRWAPGTQNVATSATGGAGAQTPAPAVNFPQPTLGQGSTGGLTPAQQTQKVREMNEAGVRMEYNPFDPNSIGGYVRKDAPPAAAAAVGAQPAAPGRPVIGSVVGTVDNPVPVTTQQQPGAAGNPLPPIKTQIPFTPPPPPARNNQDTIPVTVGVEAMNHFPQRGGGGTSPTSPASQEDDEEDLNKLAANYPQPNQAARPVTALTGDGTTRLDKQSQGWT